MPMLIVLLALSDTLRCASESADVQSRQAMACGDNSERASLLNLLGLRLALTEWQSRHKLRQCDFVSQIQHSEIDLGDIPPHHAKAGVAAHFA